MELLRKHKFNKESIVKQKENKEKTNNVLYWRNKKMKQWLNQIDLQVLYSPVYKPVLTTRAGRYWSFASRYIVQKYITILLFIAVIKDDCYIRVADCFIRVSRS